METGIANSDVLTVLLLRNHVLWDVTPCRRVSGSWRFEGPCRLYLQGQSVHNEALAQTRSYVTTSPITERSVQSTWLHSNPVSWVATPYPLSCLRCIWPLLLQKWNTFVWTKYAYIALATYLQNTLLKSYCVLNHACLAWGWLTAAETCSVNWLIV
jgi:hypothetical protein